LEKKPFYKTFGRTFEAKTYEQFFKNIFHKTIFENKHFCKIEKSFIQTFCIKRKKEKKSWPHRRRAEAAALGTTQPPQLQWLAACRGEPASTPGPLHPRCRSPRLEEARLGPHSCCRFPRAGAR
jgi:hypothetical protein